VPDQTEQAKIQSELQGNGNAPCHCSNSSQDEEVLGTPAPCDYASNFSDQAPRNGRQKNDEEPQAISYQTTQECQRSNDHEQDWVVNDSGSLEYLLLPPHTFFATITGGR